MGLTYEPGSTITRQRSMGWNCGLSGLPRRSIVSWLLFPLSAFLIGLTSIHWREAWKYGERAFRYCNHDVGHAIGTARIAAATLGWKMVLLDAMDQRTVAMLLGVDRTEDFLNAEPEHPDCLAVVWPVET